MLLEGGVGIRMCIDCFFLSLRVFYHEPFCKVFYNSWRKYIQKEPWGFRYVNQKYNSKDRVVSKCVLELEERQDQETNP